MDIFTIITTTTASILDTTSVLLSHLLDANYFPLFLRSMSNITISWLYAIDLMIQHFDPFTRVQNVAVTIATFEINWASAICASVIYYAIGRYHLGSVEQEEKLYGELALGLIVVCTEREYVVFS